MRIVRLMSAALVASVLSGCAAASPQESTPLRSEPMAEAAASQSYICGEDKFPASAVADPKGIADLDEVGRAAVSGATHDDGSPLELGDPETWGVVAHSDTRIVLIRPKPVASAQSPGRYDVADEQDHERIVLTTELWPGWAVAAEGNCTLTVDLGELQVPYVWLDQDRLPEADSRELHLMVLDPSCGGDAEMRKRIEVVRLEETAVDVSLTLGMHPLPAGAYTCEGFPPTPYTLRLETPIGEREIIDGSRVIRRALLGAGQLDAS